jgi:hypothetical protein
MGGKKNFLKFLTQICRCSETFFSIFGGFFEKGQKEVVLSACPLPHNTD